jgi:aminoglycoside phosphotransferase (APT) family kinase protein
VHADEVAIDAELVRRLVATQFPGYATLPVEPVRSTGTVNAIYRLGDELAVRLPRVASYTRDLAKELEWLPRLAPRLSLAVPEPVERGEATDDHPFPWAIYRWLRGTPYERSGDDRAAAERLAAFVRELRAIPVDGGPPGGRRPLAELDTITREAIEAIDTPGALAAWERALEAPPWDGEPVWIHADLLPPNVLVTHGRLAAVIDFGSVGVGDPAADVVAAWAMFGAAGRAAYLSALDVDAGTRERARGYALHQAALIIPYYAETNPAFVTMARGTVQQVLCDQR